MTRSGPRVTVSVSAEEFRIETSVQISTQTFGPGETSGSVADVDGVACTLAGGGLHILSSGTDPGVGAT